MILVDSSGWIAYFRQEKNQRFFGKALEGREPILVPTICLFEVYRYVLHVSGRLQALRISAAMRQKQVVALGSDLAIQAAALGSEVGLALTDSVVLATARAHDAELWTQDSDFKRIRGVRYVSA